MGQDGGGRVRTLAPNLAGGGHRRRRADREHVRGRRVDPCRHWESFA